MNVLRSELSNLLFSQFLLSSSVTNPMVDVCTSLCILPRVSWRMPAFVRLPSCAGRQPIYRQSDFISIARAQASERSLPASTANAGCSVAASLAARVKVLGSQGDLLASSIASSCRPADFAEQNHLPSSPGVLSTRSWSISEAVFWGYFLQWLER